MNLIQFTKKSDVDPALITALEELLADAKAGKIRQMIYVYDSADDNSCQRFKYLSEGSDCWRMFGMIEDMKMDFHTWMKE